MIPCRIHDAARILHRAHPIASIRWAWRTTVAAALAVSLSCLDAPSPPRTVAIGFAALDTGLSDVNAFRAVTLAVAKLNTETVGKALRFEARRPPELRGDPVYAATYLRADASVAGVVGPLWSQDMLDSSPEYGDGARLTGPPVVAVAPIATSRDLSGISRWVFRLCPTDDAEAAFAANFAISSLGSRRAMILLVNDAFGRDWSKAFSREFERRGGRVVARQPFSGDSADWTLYATYARGLHPDLIVMPTVSPVDVGFLSRLRKLGVPAPVLTGDPSAGMEGEVHGLPAFYYVAFFTRDHPRNPQGAWFVREFERANPGVRARQDEAFAYDAALAIGRAVLAVGPARERVRAFLEQLGRERASIAGATGLIAFDSLHSGRFGAMRLERIR